MMTMTPGSRLTPSVPLVPTSHPGPMEQTGNHQHSAQPVFGERFYYLKKKPFFLMVFIFIYFNLLLKYNL